MRTARQNTVMLMTEEEKEILIKAKNLLDDFWNNNPEDEIDDVDDQLYNWHGSQNAIPVSIDTLDYIIRKAKLVDNKGE